MSSTTEQCVFDFFFQAEDGIRGVAVTGVQTWLFRSLYTSEQPREQARAAVHWCRGRRGSSDSSRRCRSEERRVGKECRCPWSPRCLEKTWTICSESWVSLAVATCSNRPSPLRRPSCS